MKSIYQQSLLHISTEGLVVLELTDGNGNSDAFFDFVRGSLIPEINSFD